MRKQLSHVALGLFVVGVSTIASYFARPHTQLADLIMIYLLGVVIVALRSSVLVSLITALCAITVFDFLFIPPLMVLTAPEPNNFVMFLVMPVVAAVVSVLNQRLRRERALARRSEASTRTLYLLAQDLSGTASAEQLVALGTRHLDQVFGANVCVLLATPDGQLPAPSGSESRGRAKLAQQAWTKCAAVLDDTAGELAVWQPLLGSHGPVGVIGLTFREERHALDVDELRLIEACAAQLGSAVERASLGTAVQRVQLEVETERLRSALLSAVSHDLKTPLAAIIAAGSTLRNPDARLDLATRAELLNTIVEAAERLDGVVTNLLSATRLDSGPIELSTNAEEVEELIGAVLSRFSERLGERRVELDIPKDLPQVSVDAQLIEHVLINLVENALRYSPEGSALHIRAGVGSDGVFVEVADEGPGILPDELSKVFEKFYRGSAARKNDGGTGLGLMICRAAIRAHGGRISAQQRAGGGAAIEFTLPIAARAAEEHEVRALEGSAPAERRSATRV
ncbi:MAG TPA: ATP-binding protein [Polyangiaceae bacterium]|nr:ATP-binding protein [Polyangiaceae bacterium]